MSDQPVTVATLTKVLAAFHRDVIRPQFRQDLEEVLGATERRLTAQIEGLAGRLDEIRRIERRIGTSER